tara:strand:+ start:53 stop:541 length:489 start_codon:yes stop_codon:yes gene_type:complete
MAEAHTDAYLSRKMTAQEKRELTVDEKRVRTKAQNRISEKKYREENREKKKAFHRQYRQTSVGKKKRTILKWVGELCLQETPEEMERIYELRETQELCSSCDVKLTRTGKRISTDACMDHCHTTNRFRQICCRSCNSQDNWTKYWVDGIFGGSKLPRPAAPQ